MEISLPAAAGALSVYLFFFLSMPGSCAGLATTMHTTRLPFPASPVPRVAMNDPAAFEYIKREEPVILTVKRASRRGACVAAHRFFSCCKPRFCAEVVVP